MYFSTFDIEQATGTYEDMHLQSCKTDFCMFGDKSVLACVAAGPCTCLNHLYSPSANLCTKTRSNILQSRKDICEHF